MTELDRRLLLAALSASLLPPGTCAVLAAPAAARPAIRLGPPRDFSFAELAARAKSNAAQPYEAPQPRASHIIKDIDFDAVQKIRFRADHALQGAGPASDPVSFFHLNRYSADPVRIYGLENGKAREILYGPDYFDYSASGLDPKALAELGFS
ncbi:MAG TPA: glucan biosynthesis protein, partial [Rhizomicrobium sp.]|nr:glucan biosynthesis protein [Rhizomicrobium sp.]